MEVWQIAIACAAVTVSLAAVIISYLQYQIAKGKLAADMFPERRKVYWDLLECVSEFSQYGRLEMENDIKFNRAKIQARFLFGTHVEEFLAATRLLMIEQTFFDRYPERNNLPEDDYMARWQKITNFYDEFNRLVDPYIYIQHRT